MGRRFLFSLTTLLICAPGLGAQATSPAQSLTVQVSDSLAWTDTNLDLQSGDVVDITAATSVAVIPDRHALPACIPEGMSENPSQTSDLPLPSAPAGALLARLHAQGAAPLLVGKHQEIHIDEPSHLFLGLNMGAVAPCHGAIAVFLRRTPAGVSATPDAPAASVQPEAFAANAKPAADGQASTAASSDSTTQKTRGEQLKSQLATAAQVFMSGQFGTGKPESSSNSGSVSSGATSAGSASVSDASSAAAPALKTSDAPLDADLRKNLDNLPRRVNDQFQNLGDMVNFVIVGNQKDVEAALDAATWHVADINSEKAVLNAIMETYEKKDYLAMPMSTLFLFGRKQDFGYEMAEPIAMVASRHHFRIWKAPFTWKGKEVWVGAGTHDIGFAKDKRNGNVTHKIDPSVDGERDNIGGSLQKANKTKTISYYLPANPVQDAKNATGDGYHSDGRLLVMFLP